MKLTMTNVNELKLNPNQNGYESFPNSAITDSKKIVIKKTCTGTCNKCQWAKSKKVRN